jgi:hypothetical protein
VKGLVIGASNKYIIAFTTTAFLLIMMMPNYSVLASTEDGGRDNPSSDSVYFRILKGDLNVCSPNYQYNITICQMVMKDEELLTYVGEVTNNTHTNNSTNTTNTTNDSTNSSSHTPLSVSPEMVINEEQLQALLTNSSLKTSEGVESVRQNGTGASLSNDTQGKDVRKIYVDEYPQYEPLVIEQPPEEEIAIDSSLQGHWESNRQTSFMNNQTLSNGYHDIEEPVPPKAQQDNHLDSMITNGGSSLDENPKADTSNSYSSIPIGRSLPVGN